MCVCVCVCVRMRGGIKCTALNLVDLLTCTHTCVHTHTHTHTSTGYIVCEAYNCSAAGGTCYHGYQSCADHPLATVDNTPHHHYCQATYRKNEDGLYALYHKGCLIDGDTATKQRCSGACSIDTESGQQTLNCCCDDYLCNRNVTATNPTRLVGRGTYSSV